MLYRSWSISHWGWWWSWAWVWAMWNSEQWV
jgi:hypothetical protein